jgi:hypothetical protein
MFLQGKLRENEHISLYAMSIASKSTIHMAYIITEPSSFLYSSGEAMPTKLGCCWPLFVYPYNY